MICWHEPGPWRMRCQKDHRGDMLILYGRCRSGRRWFWCARVTDFDLGFPSEHGWSDTEARAIEDVRDAVARLAADRPAAAGLSHGTASLRLKEINTEKRRARPPSDAKDVPIVEYLYRWNERHRIIKRTKQRVYFLRNGESVDERGEPIDCGHPRYLDEDRIGFLDRQKLEAAGHDHYRYYYASLEDVLAERQRYSRMFPAQPDLAALKAAMAAAHPDKGGSSATFIEARQRYVAARRAYRTTDA